MSNQDETPESHRTDVGPNLADLPVARFFRGWGWQVCWQRLARLLQRRLSVPEKWQQGLSTESKDAIPGHT